MKLIKWTTLVVVIGLLSSCYPEKDRTIADFDIVGTHYEDTTNFENYKTYYLHDSVIIIYDSTDDIRDSPVEEANAILSTMKKNLMDYGWVEITDLANDTPDVYLEATTWNSTVTGAVYYPGYPHPGRAGQ